MKAQAYEGYFENGCFYTEGKTLPIPEHRRVFIMILDDAVSDNEHAEIWQEFLTEIKTVTDEPLLEIEKIKFREIEI